MFYQVHHLGSPDYLKLESGQDFSFPPHLHQCFEIIILRTGHMEVTVDEQVFALTAGQALLIFPNQIHALKSTHSEHLLCIFSPKLVQAFSTKLENRVPTDNRFLPDAYLVEGLGRLDAARSTAEKKGVLYSLCGQFDRTAAYRVRQTDREGLLYRIFSYVETHFSSACTLAALAGAIGYEYSYVSRYFKRAVGMSFNTYVNHYRLSHACYLMENNRISITQCAIDSGYTSLRSFNRNFKEHFGITPAQYRKELHP